MGRDQLVTGKMLLLYAVLLFLSFAEATRQAWAALNWDSLFREWCPWGLVIMAVFFTNLVWIRIAGRSPRPGGCD